MLGQYGKTVLAYIGMINICLSWRNGRFNQKDTQGLAQAIFDHIIYDLDKKQILRNKQIKTCYEADEALSDLASAYGISSAHLGGRSK
ncbi:MAG: ubiquinol-cytochrome C chaperone family protein [Anaerolineae bacterium]|nr:ubiquinol-cytochrome C chaperone family protein [Anaerolineae bacterium]